jgi:hypothetical protein
MGWVGPLRAWRLGAIEKRSENYDSRKAAKDAKLENLEKDFSLRA